MDAQPAKLHDELMAAGLAVECVRWRGEKGGYEVVLADDCDPSAALHADTLAKAFVERKGTDAEAFERELQRVTAHTIALALIERGILAEADLRE